MKKVLILGAGMVARPLVRYLLDNGFSLTQGDIEPDRAEGMIDGHPNGRAIRIDLADADAIRRLVSEHDITVSLVPPPFHPRVARYCIDAGKPMATASYVSPEMAALEDEARAAGVTILNEIGVDPGLDHMSAMQVVDKVRAKGGRILSFRSYCGGLPAPEANDNPFGYKFSWAPRGVLMASRNNAEYLLHGMHIEVPGDHLFRDMHLLHVNGVGDFEAYPNRNSNSYIDIYGLDGVRTMFRGTLRNMGWCDCLYQYGQLGLLDIEPVAEPVASRSDLIRRLAGALENEGPAEAMARALQIPLSALPIMNLGWLGMFSEDPLDDDRPAPIDVLGGLMLEKLAFRENERDMIVMKHEFVAEYPDGRREQLVSQMVDFGVPGGDSAMARTVSLPLAIGVKLMLDGTIARPGVLRPITREIYEPVLRELAQLGIVCEEKTVHIEPGESR